MDKFHIRIGADEYLLGNSITLSSDIANLSDHLTISYNKNKKGYVDSFFDEFKYDPTEVLFGIVAPKCNLRCNPCLKDISVSYKNSKPTTEKSLEYFLQLAMQTGKKINISFANNEILLRDHSEYQKKLIDVLKLFPINHYIIHSNITEIEFTHPLLDFILDKNYEFVVGANITETKSDEHLSGTALINRLKVLKNKGIKNIAINALYDIRKGMDIESTKRLLRYCANNNIRVKPSIVYSSDQNFINIHLEPLLDIFSDYMPLINSSNLLLHAMFKGEIPFSPVDGFSNFIISDYGLLSSMSCDTDYKINNVNDLNVAIENVLFDVYFSGHGEKCVKCPIYFGCFQTGRKEKMCMQEIFNSETLLAIKCKEASICKKFLDNSGIGLLNQIMKTESVVTHFHDQFKKRVQ